MYIVYPLAYSRGHNSFVEVFIKASRWPVATWLARLPPNLGLGFGSGIDTENILRLIISGGINWWNQSLLSVA